ncbi:MAG: ACT domain-containing protein [archaeon]
MEPTLDEVIKASPVIVHKGRYAYLQGEETEIKNHFLICKDETETTIVTEEGNLKNTKYEKDVKWFKLFEIKVSIPFLAPGFLAKISKTIADKGLNILVVSTFSRDYIMIREEKFEIAVEALKEVGFPVTIE